MAVEILIVSTIVFLLTNFYAMSTLWSNLGLDDGIGACHIHTVH